MLFVLAALAVLEPEGWIKDPQVGSRLAMLLQLETASYRSPTDPEAKFIAFRSKRADTPDLAQIAHAFDATGFAEVERTHGVARGVSFDERILEAPDGARLHLRQTQHGRSALEMIGGLCYGRGAALAACEERLARVSVEADADVDDVSVRRFFYWILAAFGALAALVVAVRAILRRRDLRRSAPLVDGDLVMIAGVVRELAKTIEAPLSGASCVAHRSCARGFTAGSTREVIAEAIESDVVPFVVETQHGSIHIEEPELELSLAPTGLPDAHTPRQLAFRNRHDVATSAPANFDEIVIKPGAKITLRGVVRLERQPEAATERGYRDDAPAKRRLVSLPQQPVTVLRIW